jgi:hypothetical protein
VGGHFSVIRNTALSFILLLPVLAFAAADYTITDVLVADDQYQGEPDLAPKPIYKPHEVAIDPARRIWITSNERGEFEDGRAGITILRAGRNRVLAEVNIDEPGVIFHEADEEETIGGVEIEEFPTEADPNFPTEIRLNPTVCLPVVLPPGALPPAFNGVTVRTLEDGRICAPLGAETHARHPHGIDIDKSRKRVYQVIEHSGLKWNNDRTGFEVAETTDEESGMLLVYDIRNYRAPMILTGYLFGHGAHELAVNERDGRIWQGNHEDSPGVEPNIWVDVIDPDAENPYGFIDTGFYNAVQGIEVNETLNVVYGTTHVGEKMFAFDGDCIPALNDPPTVVDYNGVPFTEKKYGENCILYSVDLRTPFLEQVDDAEEILARADADAEGDLPSVLHMHDLTVDWLNHRAYQTLHSIHHAEHTGSPEEAALQAEAILDLFGTWEIVSPAAIAGNYQTLLQGWSVPLAAPVTASMQYGDGAGGNLDGCAPFAATSLTGLIVLVDRGNCNVSFKISNIGAAGGVIGVVGLLAPQDVLLFFADGGEPQTIAGYVITQQDAQAVKDQLDIAVPVVATFDLESGVLLDPEEEEVEPEHHFMGRWVAEVDVDPSSPRFKQVTYIDLSNGFNALDFPNAEDVPEEELLTSFVHAHWVAVDPLRRSLLVSGEHTGNLGVVNARRRTLDEVIPISRRIPGCVPELDEEGNPEFEEPHVHGVQIDRIRGTAYVSDEGEHCFYESVTVLSP